MVSGRVTRRVLEEGTGIVNCHGFPPIDELMHRVKISPFLAGNREAEVKNVNMTKAGNLCVFVCVCDCDMSMTCLC